MSNKIGFWSVFALVTGSQIGTAVFMLPASLAPFGEFSIVGGIISGCGAMALSLVFASLCAQFPKTGGPHVYAEKAFGKSIAFFTGWTYWIVSWVSTTAVIITAIGYMTPFIGSKSSDLYLILEILLLFSITLLNMNGIKTAGKVEILLTILKFLPLLVISFSALYFFDQSNFIVDTKVSSMTTPKILGQVTLLTLWGFIGLETATTTAGSVYNPSKTIPRAIIFGTFCVAILYLINTVGIMGLIPANDLVLSEAPYVDAVKIMFGGNWHLLISLIAAVVCVGTLNAWMLTSGQIALGLAEDGLMPSCFARKNKNESPFVGLMVSSFGILPLLIMTANQTISAQLTTIIDFSVIAFLFVYLVCSLAFLKILVTQKGKLFQSVFALISIAFCLWVIYETPLKTLLVASLFVISGLPVYIFGYSRIKFNT